METVQVLNELLLERVLRPYRESCRYLQSVRLSEKKGEVGAWGRFAIAESCYIDDTGHFNAVEFNICYNQLAYYLIAKCVEDSLFPVFSKWSLEDYWERQLPNVLIYRHATKFRRVINPRSFEGGTVFQQPVIRERPDRPDVMFVDTTCTFHDDDGGSAEGEVTLALTRLP
jgi:hypothetical protein